MNSGSNDSPTDLWRFGTVVTSDPAGATLQVSADEVAGAVSRRLGALPVADLTAEDPPLEEVMKELFARSREEREAGAAGGVG